MLLSRKAMEVEQEISRLRMNALKTEEEKVLLERKTRESEILTARLVEESKKRTVEAEKLKNELIHARVAEKEAKEKLLNFLSRTTASPSPPPNQMPPIPPLPIGQLLTHSNQMLNVGTSDFLSSQSLQLSDNSSALSLPVSASLYDESELNSYDLLENGDISELSLEIEKERVEYLTKSKQVQNQLKDLRCEIEMLKICEKQSNLDKISAEQMRLGENKYSTLKKATKQSAKARVAFYEEL